MTATANDNLQKQIQRGEVNYTIVNETDPDNFQPNAGIFRFAVETGSNQCYLSVDYQVQTTALFILYENVTSVTSSESLTIRNMNRNISKSVSATVDRISSQSSGGSEEVIAGAYYISAGSFPQLSPLNLEAGLLLKANTIYVYRIDNFGNNSSTVNANIFLREI